MIFKHFQRQAKNQGDSFALRHLVNPFTSKISLAAFLTVCYTNHMMLFWRIWDKINK